jgi:hypothetical protein
LWVLTLCSSVSISLNIDGILHFLCSTFGLLSLCLSQWPLCTHMEIANMHWPVWIVPKSACHEALTWTWHARNNGCFPPLALHIYLRYDMIWVRWRDMTWLEWCDVMWPDVTWHGMKWHDMIWYK